MKGLIAGVLLVLSIQAQAVDADMCDSVQDLARSFAIAHHGGLPISETAKLVKGDQLYQSMAFQAYSLPYLHMDGLRDLQIEHFSKKYYQLCLSAETLNDI